jgi:hypothetical protein
MIFQRINLWKCIGEIIILYESFFGIAFRQNDECNINILCSEKICRIL